MGEALLIMAEDPDIFILKTVDNKKKNRFDMDYDAAKVSVGY